MFKDSKIYVAGHSGLLGSALMRRLPALGYGNIVTRTRAELDLTDQARVAAFFEREKPEYVFLSAGLTGGIVANSTYPAKFLYVNMMMQANVFESALKCGVKGLVFYGSSCVYPKHCTKPMTEEMLMTGPIEPTSEAYAAAKIAGLIGCRAYNKQHGGRRFIALLPNSMYGPGDNFDPQNSHVMSAMVRKFHEARERGEAKITLWGSGSPRREFVYADDAADASIFAMNNAEKLENTHYNIGSGVDYSIKELAVIVAEVVGYKGSVEWDTTRPDGTPRKLLDSSRFLALGWKPTMELSDGIRKTYEWFLANPNSRRG